ncbi:cAMP-dependent protein kinase inhibitor gamma [Stigmatopora argus]
MMDVETSYSDFINCDRSGRRNAVPDIAGKGKADAAAAAQEMAGGDSKDAGQPEAPSAAPEAQGSASQEGQDEGGGGDDDGAS